MRAVTQDEFGPPDVLQLQEVEEPDVADDEVLVRVRAASPNPWDWHFMRGMPYIARPTAGWRKPKNKVLGGDVAGVVEAAGKDVTRFGPGDEVFGFVGHGAFADYVSAPQGVLAAKPSTLTFDQAATVPLAGSTALQGLRDVARVQPGQSVLIVGASGGVGTFAIQLAKAYGAYVTGVCSTRNLELVASIGADEVVDYTREDFTRRREKYDVIFQLAGTTSPSACRRVLSRNGTLVLSSGDSPGRFIGPMGRVIRAALLSRFVSQSLELLEAKPNAGDLDALRDLIDAGAVTPFVEKTYGLEDVPTAIRHLETGRARGKLVISIAAESSPDISVAS